MRNDHIEKEIMLALKCRNCGAKRATLESEVATRLDNPRIVTTATGIRAKRIKGIIFPLLRLLLSTIIPIRGSLIASHTLARSISKSTNIGAS